MRSVPASPPSSRAGETSCRRRRANPHAGTSTSCARHWANSSDQTTGPTCSRFASRVVGRGLEVDEPRLCSKLACLFDECGRRRHDARRPRGEKQKAPPRRTSHEPVHSVHTRLLDGLAEPNHGGPEYAFRALRRAQVARGGGRLRVRGGVGEGRTVARIAAGLVDRPMQLHDARAPGALVEPIDVLGHEQEAITEPFFGPRQCCVRSVRCSALRFHAPFGPEPPAQARVPLESVRGRHVLHRVVVPQAVHRPVRRQAALHRDAGSGEHQEVCVFRREVHGSIR